MLAQQTDLESPMCSLAFESAPTSIPHLEGYLQIQGVNSTIVPNQLCARAKPATTVPSLSQQEGPEPA